jgi:hypothetical protein
LLPPERRMLAGVILGQASDALESLSEAALQLLQAETAQTMAGAAAVAATAPMAAGLGAAGATGRGTGSGGSEGAAARHMGRRRGWLGSCLRHALLSGAVGMAADGRQLQQPLVARLKLLIAAAHECNATVRAATAQLP